MEALWEALLDLFSFLLQFPWTLRLASLLQISILKLVILIPADDQIELAGQAMLVLDVFEGLDPRLRQLEIMLLVKSIGDDVEISSLHSVVPDLLDPNLLERCLLEVLFSTISVALLTADFDTDLTLPKAHPHGASLLAQARLNSMRVFRIVREWSPIGSPGHRFVQEVDHIVPQPFLLHSVVLLM